MGFALPCSATGAEVRAQVVGGLRRLGDRLVVRDPEQVSVLRAQLMQAGFASREAVPIYLGARMALLVIAVGGSALLTPWAAKGGNLAPAVAADFLAVGFLVRVVFTGGGGGGSGASLATTASAACA